MSTRFPQTEEDRQAQRMREAGCDPAHHVGPINIRIEMGEDVTVDKFCDACDTVVEGWSYDPPSSQWRWSWMTVARSGSTVHRTTASRWSTMSEQEYRNATVNDFDEHPRDDLVPTLCCGGTEDNPHMVPMQFVDAAATPHGVCPECGNRTFLEDQPAPNGGIDEPE